MLLLSTILFNDKFDYTIHDVKTDKNGNYAVIDIILYYIIYIF